MREVLRKVQMSTPEEENVVSTGAKNQRSQSVLQGRLVELLQQLKEAKKRKKDVVDAHKGFIKDIEDELESTMAEIEMQKAAAKQAEQIVQGEANG